jgi:hypothetical protein
VGLLWLAFELGEGPTNAFVKMTFRLEWKLKQAFGQIAEKLPLK